MDFQALIAALLVTACAIYALWSLLPMAAKRPLARMLLRLRLRWPAPLSRALSRAAAAGGGCACDGCDAGTAAPRAPGPVPVRFHPRRR